MAESKQKREFAYGVGRRRTSVARVRLHSKPSMWGEHEVKKGDVYVNQIPALEYFKGVNAVASTVMEPLRVTNSLNTFAVTARVAGGGKKGQLDAFIHGLARALVDIIILSTNPQQYIEHDEWISEFGEVEKKENETWGNVFTKRVFYEKGEVEFNFSTPEWANPKDEAVKRIVTDGIKILYDPKDIFSELVSEIKK
jgi:ribosomal protein S9